MANCRHRPAIHEIDAGARRVLQEQGIVEESRTWLGTSAHRQFSHSTMICEVLASIEIATRMRSDLRFITWPEILAKAPEATRALATPYSFPAASSSSAIVPDGLFGIEYRDGEKKAYRFFALEIDRGTMPVARSDARQTSYMSKVAMYRELIAHQVHKQQLGISKLLILTVTNSLARMNEILNRLATQTGGSASFLFKVHSPADLTVPLPALLCEPWHRAACPALRIDR